MPKLLPIKEVKHTSNYSNDFAKIKRKYKLSYRADVAVRTAVRLFGASDSNYHAIDDNYGYMCLEVESNCELNGKQLWLRMELALTADNRAHVVCFHGIAFECPKECESASILPTKLPFKANNLYI